MQPSLCDFCHTCGTFEDKAKQVGLTLIRVTFSLSKHLISSLADVLAEPAGSDLEHTHDSHSKQSFSQRLQMTQSSLRVDVKHQSFYRNLLISCIAGFMKSLELLSFQMNGNTEIRIKHFVVSVTEAGFLLDLSSLLSAYSKNKKKAGNDLCRLKCDAACWWWRIISQSCCLSLHQQLECMGKRGELGSNVFLAHCLCSHL